MIRLITAAALTALLAAPVAATGLDTSKIEELTGLKGQLYENRIFKVSYPRSDIKATVAGVQMTPAMGLTAWAAFQPAGEHVMVMGDMVLLEDQVNPVMSAALDNGLEVTALHNHFFWDSPRVLFMHIGGMGPQEKIAAAVGAVFAKLKETSGGKGDTPHADIDPVNTVLDPKPIQNILDDTGDFAHGVLKFVFNRKSKMDGHTIGGAMGVNTWAAFAGSNEKAVVDGDFAMLEPQLQGVLKALRHGGINIVAIHNHMVGESPRIIFLHYWGIGPAQDLAKALKSALATQRN
jgi:hypothetical protein